MSPSTETSESREFASELKFVVPATRAAAIRDWARDRLAADPNGSGEAGDTYLTTSLYFDTEQFDVYRRNGSFKRSKYRVRRYGSGPILFLERKLKTKNLVSKRRSTVDLSELPRLSDDKAFRDWGGFWFQRRLLARGLHPVCQISYERTARVMMTPNGPIRFTLDRDVRAAPVDKAEFQPLIDSELVTSACILEIKYRHAMPALFKQMVVKFGLSPQPVSKYRLAIETLQLAHEQHRKSAKAVVYA